MEPSHTILAPSRRITRARRVVLCSAMTSVSVAKRQRQQIILAVVTCLLSGTFAQPERFSVEPYQTSQGTREVLSTSLVSRPSTKARWTVEEGLQNPSTEIQPDLTAPIRYLHTRTLVADPVDHTRNLGVDQVDPTVPLHAAGTSRDPSKDSGLLDSSSPTDKNSLEVLDLATPSLGDTLAKTDTSLNSSSKGLRESTDVLQPVEKGKPGLFPIASPTSPDVGSSSRLGVTPTFLTALAYSPAITTLNVASTTTATTDLTSVKPSSPQGSTQSEEDLPGTSWPLTEICRTAHLDQESTSHSGDALPSLETDFPTHQVVKEASVGSKMLEMSLSPPTLPTGMVPSEATRVVTDVFHSSTKVTAQSLSESILRVSTGMHPGSLPTQRPEMSSRSMTLLQEAALSGQRPGGTEPATRDPSESTAISAALPPSSAGSLSSSSHAHTTRPDFVIQLTSSETGGLATHGLLVPASVGSPKTDEATALSALPGGASATAEKGTEVPLSVTHRMETSETHSGVGEGTIPLVRDLATVSALASRETLGPLSTLQNGSGATSGFPVSSTSLPASHAPRTDSVSSSGAPSQTETGSTSHSPHSPPAVSPSVHFSLSTLPLVHEIVPADSSTKAVLSAHWSPTPGEGSTRLGLSSSVNLSTSLGTTEQKEDFPTTTVLPSPPSGKGTHREREGGVSPTAEPSTEVHGHIAILDGQNEPTSLDRSSSSLPTDASNLPTFSVVHSNGVETGYTVPFLHPWVSSSTSEVLDVTDHGSAGEETQSELHDGTGPITAAAGKVPVSTSEIPLPASATDSPTSITPATHGVPTAWSQFALPTVKVRLTPSLPPSSTFLTTSGMAASKKSSEPEALTVSSVIGARSASVSTSATTSHTSSVMSKATLPSQFLDAAGVGQPVQTTAGGTQHVGMVMGSSTTTPRRAVFNRTPSPLPALWLAEANGTEVIDTSRATGTSTTSFVRSTSDRSSSQASDSLSEVETKSTMMLQPNATQAVSPSSTTTELSAKTRTVPTTQAMSTLSTTTAQPASTRIIPTTQAVSPSSAATDAQASIKIFLPTKSVSLLSTTTDLPASTRIISTTQAVSPSSAATDLSASTTMVSITQAMSSSSTTTDLPTSTRIVPTAQAVSPSSAATYLPASTRIVSTTQGVSPSSAATDLPASTRIVSTTQTMSPSSTSTDLPASTRIVPMTQAVSPSSTSTDLPASTRIFPTTQAVSPSSAATDLPASTRIVPTTQAVYPSSTVTETLASTRIVSTTQAMSPSSASTDLPASTRVVPTTQAVSPSSTSTDLPVSTRIVPTTEAVSPSSAATDLPASTRIVPTTQEVSPSSTSTDLPTSTRIVPTTQAVSPSSTSTDLPASTRIVPMTEAVSPSSTSTNLPASTRIFPTTQEVSPSSMATETPASTRIISTTQAVSPSSAATDLPDSTRIVPTTEAVSPSSAATDLPASTRIVPTTQEVSPSSTSTDLPTSTRIIPTTQAVSPSSTSTDLPASTRVVPMTEAVSPSSTSTDLPASTRIFPTTQEVSPSSMATEAPASTRIISTTQAVSPSSAATDLPASTRIISTTQAMSLSSTSTDLPSSTRIVSTTQAVSPSSAATDLPASTRIFPTTQEVSPSSMATETPASTRIISTTQAMSPSSAATDLSASTRIFPTTQAVSPSSAATDLPASTRIVPTTQAVSPSAPSTDLLASTRIFPTTQAVSSSSAATDLPASTRIVPTTQGVSPSSAATETPACTGIISTTQAVSPSSAATDMPAGSRIVPTTQAVSPSSTSTDLPASTRIVPTTQAVSPSSASTNLPASTRIVPTTQAVSPSSAATETPANTSIISTTQAVSPSSAATDLPASSRIVPTTQAVSPSSTATETPASTRIVPMIQEVSPSSAATDLPASTRIVPTIQAVSLSSVTTDAQASTRILLTTQAVSLLSTTTDLPASTKIIPSTQAVSPSSAVTEQLASTRIVGTIQAVSLSSSTTDVPGSTRIAPTTQAVSPSSAATDAQTSTSILLPTQAVSLSSSTTDLPASTKIVPTIQAVSPSSTITEQPASTRIVGTIQAVSLSSSTTDVPASTRLIPTIQAVSSASTATDLPASTRFLPITRAVSPSSTATVPPTTTRIVPTTQVMFPSSTATDLLASIQTASPSSTTKDPSASSKILPITQVMPLESTATDPPASSKVLPTTQAASLSSTASDLQAGTGLFSTTQAVFSSSATTVPPGSSEILPTTQAVSPSSTTTDLLTSSIILPTTQAVSPSSSASDSPASSRILPTIQAVPPSSTATDSPSSSRIFPTVSVLTTTTACSDAHCLNNTHPASLTPLPGTSTLESAVGKKETTVGSSTKVGTPKVTYTTALTSLKPGPITRDSSTLKHLVSAPRASTVGQTAERDNITLSRRTLAVSILTLEFHLTRIHYTESLANKSSARYKKLEKEVVLTLNKMLSFYETFLRANVLHFLNGSVVAQTEAVFRGDGLVPTPLDMIRRIATAVEQREMDAFFDWRVDLRSLNCNGFSLKNLDPEVLAISFTVLGEGSLATFGGLTNWGPLESLRNEVVQSLGARYTVQNFSLVQVRNVHGDLDLSGEISVNTAAHVDISWALEALKGLVNYSVDLGSVCINDSRLSLQIFPVSFLVTNRMFSEKLLDRSSTAHQRLSRDLSKALMHVLGKYQNLLQVTIREVRGGSLQCYADVVFQPPAPTSQDLVQALALSVGPKNYLGASGIQVDPFSFTVAGETLEPPLVSPRIPRYGIALIVVGSLALIFIPFLVLLYKHLGWKEKMVIHRAREPEVMVETFELDNPTFRPLSEDNSAPSSSPTEALS